VSSSARARRHRNSVGSAVKAPRHALILVHSSITFLKYARALERKRWRNRMSIV
jgi:hypothetical protein